MSKKVNKKPFIRKTHVLDAHEATLGRLAGRAANLLRGKGKVGFRPNLDHGDFVTITNASRLQLSGKKEFQKVYYRWSGFPGGLKEIPFKRMLAKDPEYIIRNAVKHMLPKNRLQKAFMNRLTIKL